MVNLDTGTAFAFVAEGSSIRHQLKAFIAGRQLVMCQTAYDEFVKPVFTIGGPLEQARANRFLAKLIIIADNPSVRAMNLKTTRSVGDSDKIIFGTGDSLGITTMTSDGKFVRGAKAQGIDFDVYLHSPELLRGL